MLSWKPSPHSPGVSVSSDPVLLKLRIFLDVDECIVKYYEGDMSRVSHWKKLGIDLTTMLCPKMFLIRPGLRDLLHECSLFADIYLFTAGDEAHAFDAALVIDPERIYLRGVFAATSVTWYSFNPSAQYWTKDLRKIHCFHPKRSVLIDDNISNMIYQPHNGIPSEISKLMREPKKTLEILEILADGGCQDPLTLESIRDNMIEVNPLQDILADLRILSELEDIRPYLKEKYEVADKLTGHPMLPLHWNSLIAIN
jgi:hypothetical protein